nr:hypothetical protein [Eubacterium sp.]
MKRFNDFVEEQLQDEEFKNEYENIQPELDVIGTMIEKTIQRQDTSICD